MNDKMTTVDFTLKYKQIDFDIIMELILLCKYIISAVCLQVSSDTCGTCITLQFRRDTLVNSLAPAKLTVYPSMASPEAKEAYKQFFHINSLNSSIDAEETAAWRKPNAASDAGMYCTTRF